jgi:hypothetical protein
VVPSELGVVLQDRLWFILFARLCL